MAFGYLITPNEFSPSLSVPKVLTVSTLFKCPSSMSLLRFLAVSPYNIKEEFTYFQHTMAQSKHSDADREEWSTERKDEIKARPKASRANIKTYSLTSSSIWGTWCHDGSSIGLGQPHLYCVAICSIHSLSPGLAPLIAYGFSQQTFHIPGISNILGSPLQCRLHPYGFMCHPLMGCLQGS
jgi:hypothetical protein